jgi:hypothetical protein
MLLGINYKRSLLNIFDYFGYKAFTKKYLIEKVKSFGVYLKEKKNIVNIDPPIFY